MPTSGPHNFMPSGVKPLTPQERRNAAPAVGGDTLYPAAQVQLSDESLKLVACLGTAEKLKQKDALLECASTSARDGLLKEIEQLEDLAINAVQELDRQALAAGRKPNPKDPLHKLRMRLSVRLASLDLAYSDLAEPTISLEDATRELPN